MKLENTVRISLIWDSQELIEYEVIIEDLLEFQDVDTEDWENLSKNEKQDLLRKAAFAYLMEDLYMSTEASVEIIQ